MDRHTFSILCRLLRTVVVLSLTEIIDVEEMVAMFLHVLAYIVKNRVIQREFVQSDEIVSRHFNLVLLANCFGTLDRMYIKVNVPQINPLRYRTRKGEVATNVLEVCETKGDFIFVLTGWKGSVADLHILRDALSRPNEL
ncbi:hypothetical protein IC582_019578 [Cucumis melo]